MSETPMWGRGELRPISKLLDQLDDELVHGEAAELVPVATGFSPLDRVLGGGLHPGALTIIGGAPGVGKTILGLQWARNIARDGQHVVYVCYEHEESELLLRLVSMEAAELDPELADTLRQGLATSAASAGSGLRTILADAGVGEEVLKRLDAYSERLHLVRASGAHTSAAELDRYVRDLQPHRPVLFVDYLQKVNVVPEPPTESEKVTKVAEALKDLALEERIPVVAIAATDMAGLQTRRVRMHHFRGSSALVFESDVAIVMNDKSKAVSKVHLAYDPIRAATFRDWVVFTIEKNRGGPALVDLEHKKDFSHFRFDPEGGMVSDQLVDERMEDE
jgi:replicative DNA helicase